MLVDGRDISNSGLHALFGKALVTYVIKAYAKEDYRQVVVLFDQALTKKNQGEFSATVKPGLKSLGKPFHLFFHSMGTDSSRHTRYY